MGENPSLEPDDHRGAVAAALAARQPASLGLGSAPEADPAIARSRAGRALMAVDEPLRGRLLAQAGVAAVFVLNGFGYGSWVPRIAEIQDRLGHQRG